MKQHECAGCIWEDACSGTQKCEDYTPYNDEALRVADYEVALRDRIEAYDEIIAEYGDGNYESF